MITTARSLLLAFVLLSSVTLLRAGDNGWAVSGFPPNSNFTISGTWPNWFHNYLSGCSNAPTNEGGGAFNYGITVDAQGAYSHTATTEGFHPWTADGRSASGEVTISGQVIHWTLSVSGSSAPCNGSGQFMNPTYTVVGDYQAQDCSGSVHVTYSAPDSLFGGQTNVTVNIANTFYARFVINGKASSQSYAISTGIGAIIDGGAVRVDLGNGGIAWSQGPPSRPLNISVSAPSTYHCGDVVNITVTATYSDSPTPTPAPSATVLPSPSASPNATPSPFASPPPVGPPTQPGSPGPPNVSVTNPGGGTGGNVIVNNPNDFYAPVKKALEDAASGQSAPQDGSGGTLGGGGTGSADDAGDTLGDRGHLDQMQGEVDMIIDNKTNIIDKITNLLHNFADDVTAISNHTFGEVSEISMNFNLLGQAPAKGKVPLPNVIELWKYDQLIQMVRSTLRWLLRLMFWLMTFKVFASQGVQAT